MFKLRDPEPAQKRLAPPRRDRRHQPRGEEVVQPSLCPAGKLGRSDSKKARLRLAAASPGSLRDPTSPCWDEFKPGLPPNAQPILAGACVHHRRHLRLKIGWEGFVCFYVLGVGGADQFTGLCGETFAVGLDRGG